MTAGRTLQVRCTTWQQVEIFYTRKLRRGRLLSMKVPFRADVGTPVSLGLELPNQVVISIDGRIQKAAPMESDPGKTWIEIELSGFTDEVIARIKAMMADAAPELGGDPAAPVASASPGDSASVRVTAWPTADPAAPTAASARGDGSSRLTRRQVLATPPPIGDGLPADERQLFMHLTGELRRLRQLAVHDVLGVERDADADAIRLGWMRLVRRHHPDLVARYHAPAITHLAEELTILCNRAYDRLRAALVLEGRATSIGSVLQPPAGWLVGFEDISSRSASARVAIMTDEDHAALVDDTDAPAELIEAMVELPRFSFDAGGGAAGDGDAAAAAGDGGATSVSPSAAQGGESFENRARMMLSNGDPDDAQEVLAAALCVYPRSRPLRSLYYVASAVAALRKGERMLATSQLETALAHYEHCAEAAQILDYMKKHAHASHEELRRFFR
ncbi:MAG TPA: J domain-containing protein [Kofleriaceae bacterium]|nr:J domain-containing protein [Kofleriaceae bacterium]